MVGEAIGEQTFHVFIVLFIMMVFFFAGVWLMAEPSRDPYTSKVADVDEPSFNATAREPNTTEVLNVTWETKSIGYNFTLPAGTWEYSGWLGDSGWFSSVPNDYTFTVWNSTTVSNEHTFSFPHVNFEGSAFKGGMLPDLGADLGEFQDMFTDAPRIVRWVLIVLPMAFVLTLTKIAIEIVEAVSV